MSDAEYIADIDVSELVRKYKKHVFIIDHMAATLTPRQRQWHIAAARGYRKLCALVFYETGDEEMATLVTGAPHWITFTDDQVAHLG